MNKYFKNDVSVAVILFAIGFMSCDRPGSYFSAEDDFTIKDTAAVSRIEILSVDSIILSRKDGGWALNEPVPASAIAIDNFLFSFLRMSVKGIITAPDITSESAIRIKIIEGKKKHILRYYNIEGQSFLHKEGNTKLYAVEVRGFPDIDLSEVITTDPDHWRERSLLNLQPAEILKVSVFHPGFPDKDFIIKRKDGKPCLFDGMERNELPVIQTDSEKIDFYLSYFSNIFYDSTISEGIYPNAEPRWIVKLEDIAGKNYELVVYPLKTGTAEDMFRGLVKYNNQPGYKVTRFIVLDLILQERMHFLTGDSIRY